MRNELHIENAILKPTSWSPGCIATANRRNFNAYYNLANPHCRPTKGFFEINLASPNTPQLMDKAFKDLKIALCQSLQTRSIPPSAHLDMVSKIRNMLTKEDGINYHD